MRYNEQINLKLFKYSNGSFVQEAIIDDYQECSFEDNLYEAGQFSITINFNIPNSQLFQRGLFIQFGNSWKFGEITKIQDQIGEDGKGSQYRIITGFDARYILKRRVVKNMNSNGLWVMSGKGEIVLRNLINDQAGTNAEQKRKLPITNTIPTSETAIGKEYSASEQFSNLYEVCKTIATQSEIGWRLEFDGISLNLVCFEGTDRTQTVQFSTSFDSLADGEFVDSSESFANAIYVGGKGQNDDRDIYEGESAIEGNSPSGLDRFESWDNQSSMTTESEYETEALSMLNQYGQTLTMSGNGLAKCPYEYEKEYFVGDKIKIAFSGKSANAQILSITEHWAFGTYEINFSFGKPLPDLNAQLQLILKQIQKASNKTNSTDSVRWYTIPDDSVMPKADVTYNTIGFVGDVGNGATFRLYLDDEKTGAKTYHVYFKQLAGTGKLTLTTGKTGATDLVMNVGTYVAIIYVDAQGNITNTASTATNTISLNNTQPATSNGVAQALQNKVNTDTYTNTNLNTLINTGFYPVSYSGNWQDYNFPIGHIGTVLVGTTPSNNLMQMFMSDDGQLVYVRNCTTNVWSSWKKVLNVDDVTDEVASNNMNSVTSNAVANYIPQRAYSLISKSSIQGYLTPTESWAEIHYIRLAVGSWYAGCKLYIQFEGGNIADRIEITIMDGNTTMIQCYGLCATNSNCIRNLYICYGDIQGWDSNWTLWVGLLVPYGCHIYVSKIIDYTGNVSLTVDSESITEPSNIIHNISMVQGGFFKSN